MHLTNMSIGKLGVLLAHPEIKHQILLALSSKEVVLICTITKHVLTKREKRIYYKNSYLDFGIEVFASWKSSEEIVYSSRTLKQRVLEWIQNSTNYTGYRLYMSIPETDKYSDSFSIKFAIVDSCIKVHITKDGFTNYSSESISLFFCTNHNIGNKLCYEYGIAAISNLMSALLSCEHVDFLEIAAESYSCRPYITKEIIYDVWDF